MLPREEKEFEFFIRKIVQSFLSKRNPSEQDIDDVFKKLREKAETATKLEYLDIIGKYSKKAYLHVRSTDENKSKYAWKKHMEVDKSIKRMHANLRTVEKGFGVKVAGVGELTKTERKQPPG